MSEDSQPIDDAGLHGLKVLIVEDEAILAFDLEHVLRELGCIPLQPVGPVADALSAIAMERPDVVLLDLRLSDGSAAPLAVHLNSLSIPYIVVTGYDDAQIERTFRAARRPPPRQALPRQRAESSPARSEEHTSELQSRQYLVCRLLLAKQKSRQYL